MSKPTSEQIDRGLSIVEAVVSLATDVWKHRKQRRLAGGVAGKLATSRCKSTKAKPTRRPAKPSPTPGV